MRGRSPLDNMKSASGSGAYREIIDSPKHTQHIREHKAIGQVFYCRNLAQGGRKGIDLIAQVNVRMIKVARNGYSIESHTHANRTFLWVSLGGSKLVGIFPLC